jgi:hypothetical protein
VVVSLYMVLNVTHGSDDNMAPPLYSEALVHRQCSAMLEMLTSNPSPNTSPITIVLCTKGFENEFGMVVKNIYI